MKKLVVAPPNRDSYRDFPKGGLEMQFKNKLTSTKKYFNKRKK